jgi:hypothetical protein
MLQAGEFDWVDVIVADKDADGLLATMKALGVTYPELNADAAILDGPSPKEGLSPWGRIIQETLKGVKTLWHVDGDDEEWEWTEEEEHDLERATSELFEMLINGVKNKSTKGLVQFFPVGSHLYTDVFELFLAVAVSEE